jgi:hypothetical protein
VIALVGVISRHWNGVPGAAPMRRSDAIESNRSISSADKSQRPSGRRLLRRPRAKLPEAQMCGSKAAVRNGLGWSCNLVNTGPAVATQVKAWTFVPKRAPRWARPTSYPLRSWLAKRQDDKC